MNPAPAIALPEEAYLGLGHLIVNETEAAILSGIESPNSWDEVAAIFIARGVNNVIITLGGEVGFPFCKTKDKFTNLVIGRLLQDLKASISESCRTYCTCTEGEGRGHDSSWRHIRWCLFSGCRTLESNVTWCRLRSRCSYCTCKSRSVYDSAEGRCAVEHSLGGRSAGDLNVIAIQINKLNSIKLDGILNLCITADNT